MKPKTTDMNRQIILLSFFFLIVNLFNLQAQLADCITFDEPAVNTSFSPNTDVSPGDIVHYYGNIAIMSMDVFKDAQGNTEFGELLIHNNAGAGENPPALACNAATATFTYPNPVSNVCFTIHLASTSNNFINFGINDEIHYFSYLNENDLQEAFPHFSIDMPISSTAAEVSICIEGDINSFSFGSNSNDISPGFLTIDNICSQRTISTCFNNPFQIQAECLNEDSISLFIDFEPQGVNNEFFDLFIDDEFYGFYAFADLPLELTDAIHADHDYALIRIQENDNPACSHTEILSLPTCHHEGCIGFEIYDHLEVQQFDCDEDTGVYNFYLNFDHQAALAQDSFTLSIDHELYGTFSYDNLPIIFELETAPGTEHHFLVRDLLSPLCAEDTDIEVHSCAFACSEFEAEIHDFICHDEESGELIIEMDTPPTNHLFSLVGVDEPVTYSAYYNNYDTITFNVTLDANNQNFRLIDELTGCETIIPSFIDLIEECSFCEIDDVSLTPTDCDENGEYYIDVLFASAYGEDSFIIILDGDQVFGPFQNPSNTPIRIGPVNGTFIHEVSVEITQIDGHCSFTGSVTQECESSGSCHFTNVSTQAYACEDDQFLVNVEFDNPYGGDLGFYIFGDGMIFGPYQYGQSFYAFGPLNGNNEAHTVMLLDIANPACFANTNFNFMCNDECTIETVSAHSECNDDGQFFVAIDVEANHHGESFSIVGNGNNYGTFNYHDLPVTLGPFDGDGETALEFGVIDLENADCSNWTELISPNCQPCNISHFEYEVSCGEEYYDLSINFTYENPESHRFIVLIGDEIYEGYDYEDLPITIEGIPLAFHGETIRVEDFEDEHCGETLDFNIPCCDLGNILHELELTECGANGEYYLNVHEFEGLNLSDSLVINYAPAGSSIIAEVTVAYADLAAEIGPLVGDGNTGYLFVFSDQNNDCSVTRTLEPVFCDNSSCIEFEHAQGVFGPDFEHDSGDLVLEENEVRITYERNPVSNCSCNLFVLDGLLDVDFGNDHVIVTQNSGFGIDLTGLSGSFNTVNIDFYHPEGDISISVNGENPITASNFNDLPAAIADGVQLQVTFNDQLQGTLTFSGNHIESIQLFSDATAAFDNICLSLDDNIWPGDTNTDNIANHFDLLNIGIAYGTTGPSRMEINEEWVGLIGSNWADSFADGTNYKHADANGDGIVNEVDLHAIEQNYGFAHDAVEIFEALPFTDLDPVISLDAPESGELSDGDVFEIPIFAGTEDLAITDIYGLAFSVQLDPDVIDLSSLEVIYPTSWFGEPDVNTIHIDHLDEDGNLQIAISRKDLNPVSGFGTVVYLRGIIDDILAISTSTDIVVEKIRAINVEGTPFPLRPQSIEFALGEPNNTFDRDMLRSTFRVFPNPTNGMLYYSNYYNKAADKMTVVNSTGQEVLSIKHPDMEINLSHLPAGMYFLKVHLQGFIFTERIIKTE